VTSLRDRETYLLGRLTAGLPDARRNEVLLALSRPGALVRSSDTVVTGLLKELSAVRAAIAESADSLSAGATASRAPSGLDATEMMFELLLMSPSSEGAARLEVRRSPTDGGNVVVILRAKDPRPADVMAATRAARASIVRDGRLVKARLNYGVDISNASKTTAEADAAFKGLMAAPEEIRPDLGRVKSVYIRMGK
jgi:hypothetical protein